MRDGVAAVGVGPDVSLGLAFFFKYDEQLARVGASVIDMVVGGVKVKLNPYCRPSTSRTVAAGS